MKIKYTLKTEPFETVSESRFVGTTVIRDRVQKEIEFDFNALSSDDKALLDNHRTGLNKALVVLQDIELDEGSDPSKSFARKVTYYPAKVKTVQLETEQELSLQDALDYIRTFEQNKEHLEIEAQAINKRRDAEKAQMQAELDEAQAKLDAHKEAERQRKEAELEAARKVAGQIEWSSGKAVLNLYEKIMLVSGIDIDTRSWVKEVTEIDRTKKNGYSIIGEWVNDRTLEIDNSDKVYLVAGTSGSRKHQTTHYKVVVMRDGVLVATDIETDNSDAGWALKIRDDIEALLDAETVDPFAELREVAQSDSEMVTVSRELLARLLTQVS